MTFTSFTSVFTVAKACESSLLAALDLKILSALHQQLLSSIVAECYVSLPNLWGHRIARKKSIKQANTVSYSRSKRVPNCFRIKFLSPIDLCMWCHAPAKKNKHPFPKKKYLTASLSVTGSLLGDVGVCVCVCVLGRNMEKGDYIVISCNIM